MSYASSSSQPRESLALQEEVSMESRPLVFYAFLTLFLLMPFRSGFAQSGPRITPLGTKLPMPERPVTIETVTGRLDDLDEVLQKAMETHDGRALLDSVHDFVGIGRITFFGLDGPKNTFDLTIVRKESSRVLRTINQQIGELRQGTDGSVVWESFNGMTRPVIGGLVGSFVESQTSRALTTLLRARREAFTVRDLGVKGDLRIVEVEVPEHAQTTPKTRYFIDCKTWRVVRVEWITGEVPTIFSAVVPTTEAYVFSEFRKVQGILTPFEIDRFVNGAKIEETRFSSVRYNTSPKDDLFQP